MEHLEIELKFHIPYPATLRGRLQDLGAACIGKRTFEYNVRYETEDNRLLKNNCLLRLRKDRGTTLTFKSPPPAADTRFMIHREQERLPFSDLTFDNCKTVNFRFDRYARIFETGAPGGQ